MNYDKEELDKIIDDLHEQLEHQRLCLFFLLKKIGPLSDQDEVMFLDLLTGHSDRNIYFEADKV